MGGATIGGSPASQGGPEGRQGWAAMDTGGREFQRTAAAGKNEYL